MEPKFHCIARNTLQTDTVLKEANWIRIPNLTRYVASFTYHNFVALTLFGENYKLSSYLISVE